MRQEQRPGGWCFRPEGQKQKHKEKREESEKKLRIESLLLREPSS